MESRWHDGIPWIVCYLSVWAAYDTFISPRLKPGLVFLGILLGALALWNSYLFVVMLTALAKMKKPNQQE